MKSKIRAEICDIKEVGRRRDGGYRYWCISHCANATAKYGVPADYCLAAFDEVIRQDQIFILDPSKFKGGIALWGAVPAVYDTTNQPMDRGIHIHARKSADSKKILDQTVRKLRVPTNLSLLPDQWLEVDELDAINYMVSSVFNHPMKFIACTFCGFPHLDRDWFAVHKHRRHQCHGCGRQFSDTEVGIGNPAHRLHSMFESRRKSPIKATETVSLQQSDYPGGIRIWGSNPAIVWTSEQSEKEGIHLHAYRSKNATAMPEIDGTFKRVKIDGVELNPLHVRVFMAQCAMPHIRDRVMHLTCPCCGKEHFDADEFAYTPHIEHECHTCGAIFTSPTRFKLSIGNPFVGIREKLRRHAINPLQPHFLNLRKETI